MKIGRVTGTVVSTIKYEDYRGFKLLKVRPISLSGEFDGEEVGRWTPPTPGWATRCSSTTMEAPPRWSWATRS